MFLKDAADGIYEYRRACADDLEELVRTRLTVLRSANRLPEYCRQGIAYRMLDLLVEEAREHGVSRITLEATDMGRLLYEKYGFVKMEHEMELPEEDL